MNKPTEQALLCCHGCGDRLFLCPASAFGEITRCPSCGKKMPVTRDTLIDRMLWETSPRSVVLKYCLRKFNRQLTQRQEALLARALPDDYREFFPNPFLPLTWNPDWFTSTVRDLAAHIHDRTEFSAMPILADALQDAGCDDEQILAHCRSNKPHARECWVLDAILGES